MLVVKNRSIRKSTENKYLAVLSSLTKETGSILAVVQQQAPNSLHLTELIRNEEQL